MLTKQKCITTIKSIKKMEQMEHVPATGYIEQINITTN